MSINTDTLQITAVKKAIDALQSGSIDKVENGGLDIYGRSHSDKWGDLKTYFKFYLDGEGKVVQVANKNSGL